jgi:hypothetical protein
LTGTWGDTVNNGLTDLVDASVAGTAAVTMSDANYTLTVANGASDESRQMFVTLTGTLGASRDVICPAASKLYFVTNSTTGGFSIVFKTSAGTGITVPNGFRAILYCDGTNVVSAANYQPALALGTALPVASGGTGSTSTTFVNLTTNVTGTLPVANGGTGITSFGAGVATFLGTPSSANLAAAVTDETGSGSLVFGTTPTINNPTVANYTEAVVAIGNSGASKTLDLTNGTVQTCTLTDNCTFTMPTATAGKSFFLLLTQDATGSRTAVFTSVKFPGGTAPTITVTAGKSDILTFVANGTSWFGSFSQDYSA